MGNRAIFSAFLVFNCHWLISVSQSACQFALWKGDGHFLMAEARTNSFKSSWSQRNLKLRNKVEASLAFPIIIW